MADAPKTTWFQIYGTRDPHITLDLVRRKIPESFIPTLEGEVEEDLGKVFGEELPSGLVAATVS